MEEGGTRHEFPMAALTPRLKATTFPTKQQRKQRKKTFCRSTFFSKVATPVLEETTCPPGVSADIYAGNKIRLKCAEEDLTVPSPATKESEQKKEAMRKENRDPLGGSLK